MQQAMRWSMEGRRWALLALLALGFAGCAQASVSKPAATATPIAPDARLAGQLVYVSAGQVQGASDGLLEALNAQTGAVVWKMPFASTAGAPALVGGALYVGAEDATVHAFDASSGKAGWTFTRTLGVSAQQGMDGYVAVSGGVAYVTSDSGAVYALDAATGKQRWEYTLPGQSGHIYTTPVVANGLVYVAAGGIDGAVYALDAATGQPRWTLPQAGGFDGQPMLVGGTLYVGATNSPTFQAVNAQTGKSLWTYDTSITILSPAAVGASMLYIGAQDSSVTALRLADHSKAWKFQAGSASSALISRGAAPALDGTTLYVGAEDGDVYALDAATGKQQWLVSLEAPIDSPPTALDGTLFVTTEAGDVVALRERDGAIIWHAQTHGVIIASPLVATPAGA